VREGKPRFLRPLQRHLAGYTAAARINDEYYFGTDFSGRPNYIGTLGGRKYFFPRKAYTLFVSHFYPYFDRYMVSVNSDVPAAGVRKTLSVFDTVQQRFIFCDYCSEEVPGPLIASDGVTTQLSGPAAAAVWSTMVCLGRSLRKYAVFTGFLTNSYLASTFNDLCPLTGALLS
jgi:hypothetical protein